MSKPVALILGATGLVGGHCLALAAGDPYYEKTVVLGRRTVSLFAHHDKVEQHVADMDDPALEERFPAADHVFCALGTTIGKAGSREAFAKVDFTCVRDLARVAQEKGATTLVVVSAVGADPGSRVFYNRVKGEMEQAVARLGYESVTILRPSLLLGHRHDFRAGEWIAQKLSGPFAAVIPGRYRPVKARIVARAMMAAAKNSLPGVRVVESRDIPRLAGSDTP
ncbi:MAG: oxidoreductase [Desulfatibacillaceae bacterium]